MQQMVQEIVLSGVGTTHFHDRLRQLFIRERPRVVGVAAAFVSTEGVQKLVEILRRCGSPDCRLIAGIDNAVTHPEALYAARDHGWKLRIGKRLKGIFHPKLVVAGKNFSRNGTIQKLCCVYVGSSNLTTGGFSANVECGFIADASGSMVTAANAFSELWNAANPATDAALVNYAARFAEHSRRRAVSELADLGINDSQPVPRRPSDLRAQQPPSRPAIGSKFAVAAWAGLESFTGEYRFQVEFPRDAGQVISQLISTHGSADGLIDVYCSDDESTRPMKFKFYTDNSMFRLNVPNDVPGVDWARKHKDGLAVVEQGPPGGAQLRIRLLKPGADASEVIGRSAALGTWGRTSTRSYGWY
jgi:HKD family nuclease